MTALASVMLRQFFYFSSTAAERNSSKLDAALDLVSKSSFSVDNPLYQS